MNTGDEAALDHIVSSAAETNESWEQVIGQVRRCADIRRGLNSGKPTVYDVENFLRSRVEFFHERQAAVRNARNGNGNGRR